MKNITLFHAHHIRVLVATNLILLISAITYAQGSDTYGSGLKLNLDSSGKRFVRFIIWNQIWMRSISNNPGTTINNTSASSSWDISARRIRLLAYAQITPRYLVLTHFGINNQTFTSGGGSGTSGTGGYGQGKKPQIFFHDAWNEYALIPAVNPVTGRKNKYNLYLGAGLHYWNGISRMTSASTLNFLTIDAPVINWPLVDVSDQFARQFGTYIKGKWGKLNYNLHANKPFATNSIPASPDAVKGPIAVDNNGISKMAIGGYFDYQFLEQESNVLPYRVGTYLATKKVLNVGAGFYHQADGTMSKSLEGNEETLHHHDITLLGADVFADIPFKAKKKNMAVTAYSVFYHYDFGPNYLRTIGLMNPSGAFDASLPASGKSINGPGNARIFVGTGNIWYTQAGLLLPKSQSNKWRLQPFAAYTFKKLQALDDAGHYFDLGANIYLDGHHAKLTPQYSSRPVYYNVNGQKINQATKGEFLLQFQVYL